METTSDVVLTNWDGTWTYRPAVVVRPQTVEDIVEILKDEERFPSPVRPAGSKHSTARMNGDDGGTIIDMKGMKKILDIGDDHVTAQAGAIYLDVSKKLRRQGKQFHITTEFGMLTFAAAACAATKDASFPGEYGQINSYVTGVRLVEPDGTIREITEADDPEEMQLLRSSYGLTGIIFEVTMRVMPTTAIDVRHVSLSLDQFREKFPEFVQQNYSIMYYLFPHSDRIVVELRKFNPSVEPSTEWIWRWKNKFWRKYGPATALFLKRMTRNPSLRVALEKLHHFLIRRSMVWLIRSKKSVPHAQTIRYPENPGPNKYIFSMWAFYEDGFFDILQKYFEFCGDYYEKTGFRCDLPGVGYWIAKDRNALLSYSWDGPTLSIDPSSTGGKDWEEFLRAYNDFCSRHGGYPLPNQTPFLTVEQVRKSYGDRLPKFAAYRKQRDPNNRLLDSQFAAYLDDVDTRMEAA